MSFSIGQLHASMDERLIGAAPGAVGAEYFDWLGEAKLEPVGSDEGSSLDMILSPFEGALYPSRIPSCAWAIFVRERYPELDEDDQEAVRQTAIAAFNVVQQAKKHMAGGNAQAASNDDTQGELIGSTEFVDGVRKFAMDVRNLDIDLIDFINPFGEAYAILSKNIDLTTLKGVEAAIAAKRIALDPDEARDLARGSLKFKQERGRLPLLTAQDPWEKRMAEGIAFLQRLKQEASRVA